MKTSNRNAKHPAARTNTERDGYRFGLLAFRGVLAAAALIPLAPANAAGFEYPKTETIDHVDTYHGKEVVDPYRWLEEDVRESEKVANWVERQNATTFGFLTPLQSREPIKQRLSELWNYERYSTPFRAGGRYYYRLNDGLQNQAPLYKLDSLNGTPSVLLDPNSWSEDGTVALTGTSFSKDGRYLAYGVAEAGSDWNTWHLLDLQTGTLLDETIEWVKYSGATWTPDSKGILYGSFDRPEEGSEYQSVNLGQKIYYHRIGTSQDDDILVYARPDEPEWGFVPTVTDDGRYLVVTVWKGTDARYRVYWKDLTEPLAMPQALVDHFDYEYTFLGNDGRKFYFLTNNGAPKRRIVSIDIDRGEQDGLVELVPEAEDTLQSAAIIGNTFVAEYLSDARTDVRIHALDGRQVRTLNFPGLGQASGFSGQRGDTETFYTFSSFNLPPTTYHYDLLTGTSTVFREVEVAFEPNDYVVKQVFYDSKDGTRVPMFLAHRRDLEIDGAAPTLLYGYGGFDVSLTPRFSPSRLAWMEMGGVFAQANLRGGGEYGEDWHRAGTKLEKQNVFDDFIAAAEWLIDNDYTISSRLAIQGRSNGGLLVGAALTQRPDLFGAALPAVGVMDMLRFHKFTAGRFWVDDYGSSDDPEEFEALLAYSPYHNIEEAEYPATLVTTADTDDRVVPGHSFKFASRLQAQQQGDAPVLIRIESRAGHGGGKPTSKQIEEAADEWAFLVETLGMDAPSPSKPNLSTGVR